MVSVTEKTGCLENTLNEPVEKVEVDIRKRIDVHPEITDWLQARSDGPFPTSHFNRLIAALRSAAMDRDCGN